MWVTDGVISHSVKDKVPFEVRTLLARGYDVPWSPR